MIFKYSLWNKTTTAWQDSNIYCSICVQQSYPSIVRYVFKHLSERKLISIPLEQLILTDHSGPRSAIYYIQQRVNGRQSIFAKLEQIPHKGNNFGKLDFKPTIPNLWLDMMTPRTARIRMLDEIYPRPYYAIEEAQPVAEPEHLQGRAIERVERAITDQDWQEPPF
jgi:hypothetical protein